jgi:membrane protein
MTQTKKQKSKQDIKAWLRARFWRKGSLPRAIFELLKATIDEWSRDNAAQLGAALAYYTALSLAPLLVLVVVILSMVLGNTTAGEQIVFYTSRMVGPNAAEIVETILSNAEVTSSGVLATVISIGMLMFGASGVFGQLKIALNSVWELRGVPNRKVSGIVKEQVVSFVMMLAAGSLLIGSLMVNTMIAGLEQTIGTVLPATSNLIRLLFYLESTEVARFIFSFAVFTVLFAFIYKTVPDADIAWSDVWIGGAATSFLFTTGNLLIGIYLARSSMSSVYGAAGSLVALLVWVYYSAQVFFLGAEFTQVYANTYGSRILPDNDAVAVMRELRTRNELSEMFNVARGDSAGRDGKKSRGRTAKVSKAD